MSGHKLSLGQRITAVVFGDLYTRFAFGYVNNAFSSEMVRTYGIGGFFRWAGAATKAIALLESRFGAMEAQLLVGTAALLNGCTWCGQGHVLAANIIHHKATGALFPIDDREVNALQRMPDPELLAHLATLLVDHPKVLAHIQRQYELKSLRGQESGPDDAALSASIAVWDWATECSIILDMAVGTVPPTSAIGKDTAAVAAYHEARAAQRAAPVATAQAA